MEKWRHITLAWLNSKKEELFSFGDIDEKTIYEMWNYEGKEFPVSHDMIRRFRQYGSSPCCLASAINSPDRDRLLWRYGLERQIMEFFAWLKNGLGIYDVFILAPSPEEEKILKPLLSIPFT